MALKSGYRKSIDTENRLPGKETAKENIGSYIPRLQLDDGDKVRELEQEKISREQDVSKEFDSIQNEWRQKSKEHSLRK